VPVLIRHPDLPVESTDTHLLLYRIVVLGECVEGLLDLRQPLLGALLMHDLEGVAREVVQVGDLVREVTQLQVLLVQLSVVDRHLDQIENIRRVSVFLSLGVGLSESA